MSLTLIGEQQGIVARFVLEHRCAYLRLISLQVSLGILGIIIQNERQFDALVGSHHDFNALPSLLRRGLRASYGQLQRYLGISSNVVWNADFSLATLRCRDDSSTDSSQRQYARVLQHDIAFVRLINSHLIGYRTIIGTTQTIDIEGHHCGVGLLARIAGACCETPRLQGVRRPFTSKQAVLVGTYCLCQTCTVVDDIHFNSSIGNLIGLTCQLSAEHHLTTFIIYLGIGIDSCCPRSLRPDGNIGRTIIGEA